jgi:hypothetical protein
MIGAASAMTRTGAHRDPEIARSPVGTLWLPVPGGAVRWRRSLTVGRSGAAATQCRQELVGSFVPDGVHTTADLVPLVRAQSAGGPDQRGGFGSLRADRWVDTRQVDTGQRAEIGWSDVEKGSEPGQQVGCEGLRAVPDHADR